MLLPVLTESRSRMTLRYIAISHPATESRESCLPRISVWPGPKACYALGVLTLASLMTFSGPGDDRQVTSGNFGGYFAELRRMWFGGSFDGPGGASRSPRLNDGVGEHDVDWHPIPLELPLDDPYRRPPAPAGGEHNPDPDGDVGSHVIIIDLA